MKLKYSTIPLLLIISILGCTQVPLINLHAPLKKKGNTSYLAAASEEYPKAECNNDDSVFQLTYWQSANVKDPKTYYVGCKEHDTGEIIKSNYIFSPKASNKRQITIKCIDTQTMDSYRLKISSVDDQNEENLIMDQEMHSNSEIDFNPQPGKKYYITIYNALKDKDRYIFMKQFTFNLPYPKTTFYSGPTLYPTGRNYGKYTFGWAIGIAISPYATGTHDNYLFFPSVLLFNNIYRFDSTSNRSQTISNLENIGIGVSWLYGIAGGVIVDFRDPKNSQGFFGLDFIKMIGYFL